MLCCGNVASVAKVNDMLTVAAPAEPESKYHTVKSGDTLSKIAKEAYGDANAYMKIFEANKPMLSDPEQDLSGADAAHSRLSDWPMARGRQGRRQVDARHAGPVVAARQGRGLGLGRRLRAEHGRGAVVLHACSRSRRCC